MSGTDSDGLLKRLERRALWFCVLAAVVALAARRGRLDVALGVAGGGVLIGLSYWAIRSSIDGLLALASPVGTEGIRSDRISRGRRGLVLAMRFVGRYGLIGVLAYVMLVWLGLHPVGLVVGISSIVVAAAMEVVAGPGRHGRATP